MQIGADIHVSIANVDMDSLLSQNWPPNTLVRYKSWRSCYETDSAIRTEKHGNGLPKNGGNATEFLNSMDLGKVWPPLEWTAG